MGNDLEPIPVASKHQNRKPVILRVNGVLISEMSFRELTPGDERRRVAARAAFEKPNLC
jgi:hypothetical protein